MKYSLLFFLALLQTPLCYAQTYLCRDASGKAIFKDSECDSNENIVKVIKHEKDAGPVNKQIAETLKKDIVEEIPSNSSSKDDRPGKLIFSDNKELSPPYMIKVNEVRIITETEDTLVVDVIYTYKHKIPDDKTYILIEPNHGYLLTDRAKVSRGKNVARASIGLSRNTMESNKVTQSFTNTIKISFKNYISNRDVREIWLETVKYEKNWTLNK